MKNSACLNSKIRYTTARVTTQEQKRGLNQFEDESVGGRIQGDLGKFEDLEERFPINQQKCHGPDGATYSAGIQPAFRDIICRYSAGI